MATKKQKRQAAIDKHNREMEEIRLSGLKALESERQHRARKLRDEWRENHDKNHSWRKRIKECPICNDEIAAAKKAAPALGEFADAAEGAKEETKGKDVDLSKPQTGAYPDVDYGPTSDMELSEKVDA